MSQLFKEITGIASEVRGLRETVEGRLTAHTNNLTAQYNALNARMSQGELCWHVQVDAANTDNNADGTAAKPYKTIQGAINCWLEKYRFTDLHLVLHPGTYRENVVLSGRNICGSLYLATTNAVPFGGVNSPFPFPHKVIWEPTNVKEPCLYIKPSINIRAINVYDIRFRGVDTAACAIFNGNKLSYNWYSRLFIENFRTGICAYNSLASIYQTLIQNCDLGVQAWDTGILRFNTTKISGVKVGIDNPSCLIIFDGSSIIEATTAKVVNRLGGQAFGNF